jgi:hypothetical protein
LDEPAGREALNWMLAFLDAIRGHAATGRVQRWTMLP